jgi:putative ABC transport system substrate-binding protein
MLKKVLPRLRVIGVLHNVTNPTFRTWGEQILSDAKKRGLEPMRLPAELDFSSQGC